MMLMTKTPGILLCSKIYNRPQHFVESKCLEHELTVNGTNNGKTTSSFHGNRMTIWSTVWSRSAKEQRYASLSHSAAPVGVAWFLAFKDRIKLELKALDRQIWVTVILQGKKNNNIQQLPPRKGSNNPRVWQFQPIISTYLIGFAILKSQPSCAVSVVSFAKAWLMEPMKRLKTISPESSPIAIN